LTPRVGPAGSLALVGKDGYAEFQSPPPQMWDATQRKVTMPVEVTGDQLVLTPDQKLLTGKDTVFPVEIDPDWAPGMGGWALVYGVPAAYQNNSYWWGDGDNLAKVGYGPSEQPAVVAHSYFQWDIRFLQHPLWALDVAS
jgi:hypothetical protein